MSLRIYNTLTRTKDDFTTIEPGKVRMYVCGPTVYAEAHIGHAMSALVFDIVRRYLEGRYGVRAPELTTEEFLQEAQRAAALAANHRELLSAFLERCDRVKFAGYRPDSDESMATLKAARAFVEDTRVRAQEAA